MRYNDSYFIGQLVVRREAVDERGEGVQRGAPGLARAQRPAAGLLAPAPAPAHPALCGTHYTYSLLHRLQFTFR